MKTGPAQAASCSPDLFTKPLENPLNLGLPLQCPEQDSRAACSSPNLLLQGCAILGSPFSQTHLCLGETPATY